MATYDEAVSLWEQSRLAFGNVRPYTAMKAAQKARRLSPYIGGKQIDEITAAELESAIIDLRAHGNGRNGGGLAPSSLRQTYIGGAAAVRWAIDHGMAALNPFDRVKCPKGAKAKHGGTLSDEDARWVVDAARRELESCTTGFYRERKVKDAACCMYVVAALSTGMRRGEICALDWGDVADDHISVRKAVKAEGDIDEPKTGAGVRRISIGGEFAALLAAYREWQSGFIDVTDETPVLAMHDGGRLSGNTLEHWWARFRKDAGIEGTRLHDLRHTHATMLIASGVDVKTVQTRLGHSSAMMTLDVYSHAVPRNDMEAACGLDSMLMGAGA